MGSRLAQVSSGAQWMSISVEVLKLTGIHQGATLFSPDSPGSLAVPQPSSPSIVNGLCSRALYKVSLAACFILHMAAPCSRCASINFAEPAVR